VDITANGAPPVHEVITQMLGDLEGEVPPNRARLLSVQERPVGIANWRGVDVFGSLVPVALKGGRLEAGVLFELSRSDPDQAEAAARELHGTLLAARDDLRRRGFLRIDGPEFPSPRKTRRPAPGARPSPTASSTNSSIRTSTARAASSPASRPGSTRRNPARPTARSRW